MRRALGLLGLLACAGLCLAVGRSGGLPHARWTVLALVLAWVAASLAATLGLLGVRRAGALVVGAAVVVQALALLHGPQLSDDLYRYVWDAEVASAGIDAYAEPPLSPALQQVRTPFLWPSAEDCVHPADGPRVNAFRDFHRYPGCTPINRPQVRTIYPPAAQLVFRADEALVPSGLRELRAQLPTALWSLALTGLLVLLLRRGGRTPAWALLYATSPLAGVEAAMDAHVDGVAALAGVAAVAVLSRARLRAAAAAAGGALLAVATLVKLYPALLVLALLPRVGLRSARTLWFVGAGLVTTALLYLPHVLSVGVAVVGYLPGYLAENGYATQDRYPVLVLLGLGRLAEVLVPLALLAVAVVSLSRPLADGLVPLARRATLVLGAVFLVVTPGNAWYCCLLVALAALAERPEWVGVVAASYTSYVDALLGTHTRWPGTAYLLALLLVLGAGVARRRARRPAPAA